MKKCYFELSEKEIKKVIKEFENYIKKENSIIEDIKGVKPLQYCYTSSSAIAGVYLPNNEITLDRYTKHHYNFCCLGKNENDELGFWCSLKSEYFENETPKGMLQEFIFIAFDPIDRKYFEIKENIKKDIETLKKEIDILNSLKLVTKKDGNPFADYKKNFTFEYKNRYTGDTIKSTLEINISRSWNDATIASYEIIFNYDYKEYFYLKDDEKGKYTDFGSYKKPVELLELLNIRKSEKMQRLQEKEKLLKDSLKIFKELETARKKYINFKTKYYKLHYFNKYLEVASYETN